MATTSVNIDKERLKKWITEQGETEESMSVEIGYTATAIKSCIKRGVMTAVMFKALQLRYGLKPEDIIKADTPEPAAKAEPETTGHDCTANAQAMELLAKAADEEQRILGERGCWESWNAG